MLNSQVNAFLGLVLLGVVDQIHGENVQVEISGIDARDDELIIPRWLFPCEIQEGDTFHFTKRDGALELRCGEPKG